MNKRKFEFSQELFNQMADKNFSKVSISEICESLSCSRQSFYYYFKTLEDCLSYYLKETFKTQIKEEYVISDLFNYIDSNYDFVNRCNQDERSKIIFWQSLSTYVKKLLDFVFSKNIVEYLALYADQKNTITSFYVAGLLEIAGQYFSKKLPSKEKCIAYCKAIVGNGEDTRSTILRFTR